MICLSIGIINHPKPEGTSDTLGWRGAKHTVCKCVSALFHDWQYTCCHLSAGVYESLAQIHTVLYLFEVGWHNF